MDKISITIVTPWDKEATGGAIDVLDKTTSLLMFRRMMRPSAKKPNREETTRTMKQ